MNRYKAKYGADPTSVLRVIAEDPITPAEAIIKVKDAYFPVAALNERAQQLDTNPHIYDDIYVGELFLIILIKWSSDLQEIYLLENFQWIMILRELWKYMLCLRKIAQEQYLIIGIY